MATGPHSFDDPAPELACVIRGREACRTRGLVPIVFPERAGVHATSVSPTPLDAPPHCLGGEPASVCNNSAHAGLVLEATRNGWGLNDET
jgi:hypothetical protein